MSFTTFFHLTKKLKDFNQIDRTHWMIISVDFSLNQLEIRRINRSNLFNKNSSNGTSSNYNFIYFLFHYFCGQKKTFNTLSQVSTNDFLLITPFLSRLSLIFQTKRSSLYEIVRVHKNVYKLFFAVHSSTYNHITSYISKYFSYFLPNDHLINSSTLLHLFSLLFSPFIHSYILCVLQ